MLIARDGFKNVLDCCYFEILCVVISKLIELIRNMIRGWGGGIFPLSISKREKNWRENKMKFHEEFFNQIKGKKIMIIILNR